MQYGNIYLDSPVSINVTSILVDVSTFYVTTRPVSLEFYGSNDRITYSPITMNEAKTSLAWTSFRNIFTVQSVDVAVCSFKFYFYFNAASTSVNPINPVMEVKIYGYQSSTCAYSTPVIASTTCASGIQAYPPSNIPNGQNWGLVSTTTFTVTLSTGNYGRGSYSAVSFDTQTLGPQYNAFDRLMWNFVCLLHFF